jgi:hypothetical protein
MCADLRARTICEETDASLARCPKLLVDKGKGKVGEDSVQRPAATRWRTQYQKFYTPPGAPGDLIRTAPPKRLVFEPSGQLRSFVATGTRIMYRSRYNRGAPIAVTSTYFEPDNPWPGRGRRPLVALGPGVYGIGDSADRFNGASKTPNCAEI